MVSARLPAVRSIFADRHDNTGAYLVIFIECVRVLWAKYANGKGGVYLSAVALAIFALVTSVSQSLSTRCPNAHHLPL